MKPHATLQLQLDLSYKTQPRDHPRLRAYLERGYRIAHFQRISDGEALVTLELEPADGVRSGPA